jgi:hypothetical protein
MQWLARTWFGSLKSKLYFFKRQAHECRVSILRMPRCVVRQWHPNPDVRATSRGRVTTTWKSWCLLSCFVFYYFCCLCLYFVQVEMENVSKVWKIDWNLFHCPSNIFLWKCSSILLFFFLQNVCCSSSFSCSGVTAALSFSMFTL